MTPEEQQIDRVHDILRDLFESIENGEDEFDAYFRAIDEIVIAIRYEP